MKILLIAPTYLPAQRANTLQVMKMAQAIKGEGHNVCVVVPDPGIGKPLPWDDLAIYYGLNQRFDVEWLTVDPRYRSYDYGLKALRYARFWEADLLYTRLPQAAAFASLLNVPTIYEVHDLPSGVLGPWLFRLFLRGTGARRLVVITQSLRKAIEKKITSLPDSQFAIIAPDGVDLIRYENLPRPTSAREFLKRDYHPQLPVSRFTAGYTGNLYAGRGVDLILDIAAQLPDVNFLLVGGDPQTVEKYHKEAGQRNLENILLTGFIPNAILPRYQAACDVLLMPYQQKVAASSGGDIAQYLSPMKLFEYLACGRVIVSSDLPVLREVLNEGNSILLPPDDTEAWIQALISIREDSDKQAVISVQAQKESRSYSWEARAKKIFDFDSKERKQNAS